MHFGAVRLYHTPNSLSTQSLPDQNEKEPYHYYSSFSVFETVRVKTVRFNHKCAIAICLLRGQINFQMGFT